MAGGGGGDGRPGRRKEIGGDDNGGAAEEMDQGGSDLSGLSGRVCPTDWATKTKAPKKDYWKRRQSGKG